MLITRQYRTQSIVCCLLLRLVTLVRAAGIIVVTPFLPPELHGRCSITRQYTTQSIICCLLLHLMNLVRAAGIVVFAPFLPPELHGRCRALPCLCPAARSRRRNSASYETLRGWPLPYAHIQTLSSYNQLPFPRPALVSATAPSRSPIS